MDGIVTLTERRRRTLEAMQAAVPWLDAALTAYARAHGGRFIRFGSSATGRLRLSSDIDLIADFPTARATREACTAADALCVAQGLTPDGHALDWVGETVLARALAEGIVLA